MSPDTIKYALLGLGSLGSILTACWWLAAKLTVLSEADKRTSQDIQQLGSRLTVVHQEIQTVKQDISEIKTHLAVTRNELGHMGQQLGGIADKLDRLFTNKVA